MTQSDNVRRDNRALGGPIFALNAAIQRINATLDLGTMLCEPTESARAFASTRMVVIITLDDQAHLPAGGIWRQTEPEVLKSATNAGYSRPAGGVRRGPTSPESEPAGHVTSACRERLFLT